MRNLLPISILALTLGCGLKAETINRAIPAPAANENASASHEVAVLAGGCFWGMQGVFEHVNGVTRVVAGYAGGDASTAHYEMVGTETTGHAESVEITFDPKQVSYGQLLQVYFSVAHDPTELNRQGPDSGPSYRSEIFYATPEQERIATAYVAQLNQAKIFSSPIVTKIEPLKGFYAAEDYHQDYLIHHPGQPYIVFNDLPKIEALRRTYPQFYRDKPVMVTAAR
ncbi:MAG TPA: peptide-methionine (S)-S-oxide reductase MsrA [Thermoanaerobaculia bacterium]